MWTVEQIEDIMNYIKVNHNAKRISTITTDYNYLVYEDDKEKLHSITLTEIYQEMINAQTKLQ